MAERVPDRDVERGVGQFRELSDPRYLGRIAANAGLLADYLRSGTENFRGLATIDSCPVSIGVVPGSGAPFSRTQVYAAILAGRGTDEKPHFVTLQAHTIFGSGANQPCSQNTCGVAQGAVKIDYSNQRPSYGYEQTVHATPFFTKGEGYMLDMALETTIDGLSGVKGPYIPLDPRYDSRAMQALVRFRQQGHVLRVSLLEQYAELLTGPVEVVAPQQVG